MISTSSLSHTVKKEEEEKKKEERIPYSHMTTTVKPQLIPTRQLSDVTL